VVFENVVIRECSGPAVRIVNEAVVPFDPFATNPDGPQPTEQTRVSFRNVRFFNNEDSGGSSFFKNAVDGGAIQVTQATSAIVEKCEFERNGAVLGGAIRVDGGSLEVFRSVFIENKASISGGAISGSSASIPGESTSTLFLKNSTFLRNEDLQGGEDRSGLKLNNGAPLETSEFLSFPTPQSSGGALYLQGFADARIEECVFDGNIANPAAGAIFVADNHRVKLLNNTFRNNLAHSNPTHQREPDLEQGGAIYVAFTKSRSKIEIERCLFENNTASYGGGVLMVMPLVVDAHIVNCKFIENKAHLGGGGLVLRNVIQVRTKQFKVLCLFCSLIGFRLGSRTPNFCVIGQLQVALSCLRMELGRDSVKGKTQLEILSSRRTLH